MTIKSKEFSQKININLNELISALSAAFDLADKVDREHSFRTTYLSWEIAKGLELGEDEITSIYFASLLHDIVPVGEIFNENTVFDIVSVLPVNAKTAAYVLELWKYKKRCMKACGSLNCKNLGTKIIYIAEQFEMIYSNKREEWKDRDKLRSWVKNIVGNWDEKIASILLSSMTREAFWLDMRKGRIKTIVEKMAPVTYEYLNIQEMEGISLAFTSIIDRKNAHTGTHSQRVGVIAYNTAVICGFDDFTAKKVKIAGYLHDLGKLAVPEEILNKPGKLDFNERQIIYAHPYYTYEILEQVRGLEDVANWAGNHHERLNGSGYPWKKENLSEIDQIIAVSDIYEALSSARPYRGKMEHNDAMGILKKMALKGELSKYAVEAVEFAVSV